MTKKILIVEDDTSILHLLEYSLQQEGYDVIKATDGVTAVKYAVKEQPDLILMDWMLPKKSGLDAIKEIRQSAKNKIPIIMLTARGEEQDKVHSLDIGADDYIVKPFSPKELFARIRSVLRRYTENNTSEYSQNIDNLILTFKDITINTEQYAVFLNDEKIVLSIKEYNLLKHFIKNQNKVYTREQLLDILWGQETYVEQRTVDVHLARLRKVLKNKNFIRSIRGIGYILDA